MLPTRGAVVGSGLVVDIPLVFEQLIRTIEGIGIATIAAGGIAWVVAFRVTFHVALHLEVSVEQCVRCTTSDATSQYLSWLAAWRDGLDRRTDDDLLWRRQVPSSCSLKRVAFAVRIAVSFKKKTHPASPAFVPDADPARESNATALSIQSGSFE